jgi:hypothetical protein
VPITIRIGAWLRVSKEISEGFAVPQNEFNDAPWGSTRLVDAYNLLRGLEWNTAA